MMQIALLGATSQIARDLVVRLVANAENKIFLYARRPEAVQAWLKQMGIAAPITVAAFDDFGKADYDAVINCVGVGDPAKAAVMAATIFETTQQFDQLALNYIKQNRQCRYLFMSSGAAYGGDFAAPATREMNASIPCNTLRPHDYYGAAKLAAECYHRTLTDLPIIDIRLFNYFSRTSDLAARFFITDMLRALREHAVFVTSDAPMTRDYLHPDDFHRLVAAMLAAPATNTVVDTYSAAPVEKNELLTHMTHIFGLKVEQSTAKVPSINATGNKTHYYSTNRHAASFGYAPAFTSLTGLTQEINAIMDTNRA
jgi:nucleoside-diphosphate-sugar epimerase